MLRRPAYSECRLYYDGAASIDVGHYLKTPGGSAYRIQSMRQNKVRAYRKHLVCLRWPIAEIPSKAIVHPLYWYARKRRQSVTLTELQKRRDASHSSRLLR
jgi:hypothetical protein